MDQLEITLLCRKTSLGLISEILYTEILFHVLVFYLCQLLVTVLTKENAIPAFQQPGVLIWPLVEHINRLSACQMWDLE